MLSLVIKNPNLPSGYSIVSTTWQVAKNKDFIPSSIVAESIENAVNKLNIQFDIDLELGVKYFARCRVIYNKGFSNYSNINVFIAKDLNEIEFLIVGIILLVMNILNFILYRKIFKKKQ